MAKNPFDDSLTPFDIPLNGGLKTDLDPIFLGLGEFQSLKNLRHKPVGKQGLSGMTQVGSFSATLRTGFQYKKTNPDESHTFVHAGSSIYKSVSGTVPNSDTYASFLSASADPARMGYASDDSVIICNGTDNYIWRGIEARCGSFATVGGPAFYSPGLFWNDYTSAVNNNLQTTGNYATTKVVTGHTYIVIGSYLPIQGITLYLKTASTASGTLSLYQRTGEGDTGLTVPISASDGTSGLTKTGKITFTAAYPKPTIVNDTMAFYYLLDFDGSDDGVEIYRCTLDVPVQPIQDLWNGIPLMPLSCLTYKSSKYADILLKVSGISAYVSTDANTYADLVGLVSTNVLYVGFDRRITGLQFNLPDDGKQNTAPNSLATVYYYNGTTWVSVGNVNDGTSPDLASSMVNSGTMSWVAPITGSEFMTSLFNTVRLYYYKISFVNAITGAAYVHQITGIPAQNSMDPYKFPLFWQNRLILCNDILDRNNNINVSASNSPQVFNGGDSGKITIGDGQELVAGTTLFTRYGGSLYDNAILLKKNSVHLIDGATLSEWRDYMVSDSVGCIAPQTLQKCDMGYEVAPGLTKHVLLWMSFRGVELFDGNTLACVSTDIYNFWDKTSSDYINVAIADTFKAFYDATTTEYHVLFATGSSTTLNKELVYDLVEKKWYEVNRGTGKGLTFGFSLSDAIGIQYNYAGTTDYKLERLEYGTTFDGNAIAYELHTGDIGLAKTLNYQTKVRNIKFIAKAKTISTANVTITHYADGSTTGTTLPVFTQNKSGYRIYQTKRSVDLPEAVVHSFKVTVSTTNETVGFEPLYFGGLFKVIREDI